MKSTFWMSAQQAEVEIKKRERGLPMQKPNYAKTAIELGQAERCLESALKFCTSDSLLYAKIEELRNEVDGILENTNSKI